MTIHSPPSPRPLVPDPANIRVAMLGMVEGNGHPYSWSAIINGKYDAAVMQACGYPVIPQYLGAQPPEALGLAGVRVTHIWCDRTADARQVARATFIDHVVARPEDVLGQVDAVIIPTDHGGEHVKRARLFIETGLPVFIDKPLTDNESDLRQFIAWWQEGRPILTSSCMRYAAEFADLRERMAAIGEPRAITATMIKTWERYGIHALESVYGLLPPGGWLDVSNTGDAGRNIVHLRHASGVDVVLIVVQDLTGGFGHVHVVGTRGAAEAKFVDTFGAFKSQLMAWVGYLRTGLLPIPREQTTEQMKIIVAGIRSRSEGGRRIALSEITA